MSYKQLFYQGSKEVCFQEFLRLLIPSQPKARLVSHGRRGLYVQSKAVPNSQPFIFNPNVSPIAYGPGSAHQGLGELNFYLNNVFFDNDQELRNYLVDTQLRIYRIDFGLTDVLDYHLMLIFDMESRIPQGLFHSQLKYNLHYQLERNRALLKFLLLPAKIIEGFFNYHLEESGGLLAEKIIGIQSTLTDFIRGDEAVLNNVFPRFKDYIKSQKARADAYMFENYLMTFKLKGKLTLEGFLGEPVITKRLDGFYNILKAQCYPNLTRTCRHSSI